MLILFTEPVTW